MAEKPILFSGPMVRAILDGRKTQTRRVMKPQPIPNGTWSALLNDFLCVDDCYPPSATLWNGGWLGHDAGEEFACPYGEPSDRLWVRETHGIFSVDYGTVSVGYKARLPEGKSLSDTDGGLDVIRVTPEQSAWAEKNIDNERWRSPIFIPRWASRITLQIIGVRVERLQEISEADAKAEGMTVDLSCQTLEPHKVAFGHGWDKINGKRAPWDSNPWVWALTFQRI